MDFGQEYRKDMTVTILIKRINGGGLMKGKKSILN